MPDIEKKSEPQTKDKLKDDSKQPDLKTDAIEDKKLEEEGENKRKFQELKIQVNEINQNTIYTEEVRQDLYLGILKELGKLIDPSANHTHLHSDIELFPNDSVIYGLSNIHIDNKDETLFITFDDHYYTTDDGFSAYKITLIINSDLSYTFSSQ